MPAGEPTLALQSLRPNLTSAQARYGADSVELGNLLLTATDVLTLALRAAGTRETRRYGRGRDGRVRRRRCAGSGTRGSAGWREVLWGLEYTAV